MGVFPRVYSKCYFETQKNIQIQFSPCQKNYDKENKGRENTTQNKSGTWGFLKS